MPWERNVIESLFHTRTIHREKSIFFSDRNNQDLLGKQLVTATVAKVAGRWYTTEVAWNIDRAAVSYFDVSWPVTKVWIPVRPDLPGDVAVNHCSMSTISPAGCISVTPGFKWTWISPSCDRGSLETKPTIEVVVAESRRSAVGVLPVTTSQTWVACTFYS